MAQVVQCLPSKYKTLSSYPSTITKKKKKEVGSKMEKDITCSYLCSTVLNHHLPI
jgi:hypothetical protein